MTVKRLKNYGALFNATTGECRWRAAYRDVGNGWCRPTAGYVAYRQRVSEMECAQRCSEAGSACRSFARDSAGACSLYPLAANASSGVDGVRCFNKAQ